MMKSWRTRALIAVSAGCLVVGVSAPLAGAKLGGPKFGGAVKQEVIATGLDNPRGLGFAADGSLFVAEAGRGGDGPCGPGAEGGEVCFGTTGAITRIKRDVQERVITGLPSLGASEGPMAGTSATGPARVGLIGSKLFVLMMNPGGGPETREAFGPDAATLGKLLRYSRKDLDDPALVIADFPPFEKDENPDGGAGAEPGHEIDSNPYGLLAGVSRHLVTDAGGNDLLEVDRDGEISVLATFPIQMVDAPPFLGAPPETKIPMQSVPTSIVRGPDGAYYVGELTGFPFTMGAARVWRLRPGGEPRVFATGFTNIIDIKFDRFGRLHVLEISHEGLASGPPDMLPTGALIRVGRDGTKHVLTDDLTAPGGLAFDRLNRAYVTNKSILPGAGEVVRISGSW